MLRVSFPSMRWSRYGSQAPAATDGKNSEGTKTRVPSDREVTSTFPTLIL